MVEQSPWQVWWLAARPKTLSAGAAPVFIGIALAAEAGRFAFLPAITALLGAILIQIGTNLANDYFDCGRGADQGERLGPLRVTQAGLVTPLAMKRAIGVVFGLASLCGLYLIWHAGWPILLIGLLSILFGIAYTAGPYPLAYHGLGELFVLVFFGPVAVGGTYYVQALQIAWPIIIAGLAPGLFSVAILTVNNLRDINSDRTSGKFTLAVRFGERFARTEYVFAVVLACCVPLPLWLLYRPQLWSLLPMITLIIADPTLRRVWAGLSGRPLNDTLATTGRLLMLYAALFCVGWLV